jgi:hypothetical protein
MTQDEIIEMAILAGLEQDGEMWFSKTYKTDMDVHISHLEAFAKLVEDAAFKRWAAQTKLAVQDEREACAKVCDNKQYVHPYHDLGTLIRARGEA